MEKKNFVQSLCTVLVEMKLIGQKESKKLQENFANASKVSFDHFLLSQGLIPKKHLLLALSHLYQVPYFDVAGIFFDSALLHKIPKSLLLNLGVIPYQVESNILILIASEPSDENLLSSLGDYVSYSLQFKVGLRCDIERAIQEFYEKSVTQVPENDDQQDDLIEIDNYESYQKQERLQREGDGSEQADKEKN